VIDLVLADRGGTAVVAGEVQSGAPTSGTASALECAKGRSARPPDGCRRFRAGRHRLAPAGASIDRLDS
jgi:hypothetical protein